MITDLLCGFGCFAVYLLLAVLIGRGIHLGQRPSPPRPAPNPDEDLLADQPVEVLSDAEVDCRFHTLTRGGPHREWWA